MKGMLSLKRTIIMVVAVFSALILATIPLATYLVKNRDPEINIAIVSDTHVMAESQFEMSEVGRLGHCVRMTEEMLRSATHLVER